MAVQWNAEISVPKLSGYQHAHDLFGAFVKLPHELHISLDHIDYSGAAETTDSEAAEQRQSESSAGTTGTSETAADEQKQIPESATTGSSETAPETSKEPVSASSSETIPQDTPEKDSDSSESQSTETAAKQKPRLKQILSRNSNISYTITYDPQSGLWKEGTSDLYEETYSVDTAAMIVTAPKRSGYTFLGWNTGSVTYQPGDTYHEKDANGVLTDATLTAQWRKNSPDSNQDTKPKDDSGKTPNTGDENNLSMWFSLLIATAAAAVWLAAIRKRKTNDH